MPFEWVVAMRYLREGRTQTMLILSGIGVGVGVIIFLSALINGLQESIIDRTLGTQAHIVVRPLEDSVRPLRVSTPEVAVATTIEHPPQRLRSILGWQQVIEKIRRVDGVIATAPTIAGAAFAIRGQANKSVAIRGVDAETYGRIVDMESKIVTGRFRLLGTEAVVGKELAEDLGVGVGDKLRLSTAEGRTQVFNIAGVFDAGQKDLNERWVFISLRNAQTLLDLLGGVSTIEVKVQDIFAAEKSAQEIAARTSLIADSWMKLNSQLLTALRSQNSSSVMIQTFVIIAVALGIASVLIVSVVQKSREIGILKAIGTPTGRIMRIFLIQGAVLGVAGSVIGIILGTGLAHFFASLAKNPDGSPTFPVTISALLIIRSTLLALGVGLVSATAPARRASKLDPAEVMRYG